MEELHFFAETNSGKILEFFAVTFVIQNQLFAWTDPNVIEDIINNNMSVTNTNLHIRTARSGLYQAATNGYCKTSDRSPTAFDLPLCELRSMWYEEWNLDITDQEC